MLSGTTLIRTVGLYLCLFPLAIAQTPAATPYALQSQAMKAYQEKHFLESAHLFDEAFAAGLNRAEDAYNAACSYALTGDAPKALAYLDRSIQLGFRDPDQMKADPDLIALRTHVQFSQLMDRAQANQVAYDAAHHDPDRAAIVTSDIDLFWTAYQKMQSSPHPEEILEDDYLRRGSPGLQDFIFARIHSAADLLQAIQASPKYYAAIQPGTQRIKDFAPQMHASFRKLQQIYPAATFPDIYFLIGRLNTAGTTAPSGLLIGADMFGRGPNVPMNELTDWHRMAIKSSDAIPYVVAHELIHYQQHTPSTDTLLSAAIQEGSADFLGELISGSFMNQAQYKYGIAHEAELWQQFSREMHGKDTSHWLYEGKTVNGRPADMAYFEGYRIAQAFYERATDKKKAVRDILNFQDPDIFLSESGYATQQKSSPTLSSTK
jgi:hypothetical protein